MNVRMFLVTAVDFLSSAIFVLVFVRIVLSWMPNARNALTEFVWDITEPLLKPFRRFNPKGSPLDLSPIILIILVEVVRNLVLRFI